MTPLYWGLAAGAALVAWLERDAIAAALKSATYLPPGSPTEPPHWLQPSAPPQDAINITSLPGIEPDTVVYFDDPSPEIGKMVKIIAATARDPHAGDSFMAGAIWVAADKSALVFMAPDLSSTVVPALTKIWAQKIPPTTWEIVRGTAPMDVAGWLQSRGFVWPNDLVGEIVGALVKNPSTGETAMVGVQVHAFSLNPSGLGMIVSGEVVYHNPDNGMPVSPIVQQRPWGPPEHRNVDLGQRDVYLVDPRPRLVVDVVPATRA